MIGSLRVVLTLLLAASVVAACSEPAPSRGGGNGHNPADMTEAVAAPDDGDGSDEPIASAAAGGLARFSRYRAMKTVRKLAEDIGVRVRTTRNETRAARYLARRFRAFGYEVKVPRFEVDGATSRNVIATRSDAIRYPFVLGGHMDTVPRAPGANDNASGVAVVLEMARLLKDDPRGRFFRFVAFGSEEYGKNGKHHVGSQVMVNRMSRRARRKTPGMLSVDMIADGRPLIAGYSGFASSVVARDVYRKLERAGIGVTFRVLCDCSDHGPFERRGIPAAFLWSGDEPNYHDPSDTVENMSVKDLARTGRGVRAYVRTFSRALIRRYRRH
jgi:aminopeptidase YwaD